MNNFEKRKFLDYLDKLINNISFTNYSFTDVFEFMLSEFKIKKRNFKYDQYNELSLETGRDRIEFKKAFKQTVKDLKTKIKPRNTKLEKKLLIIKDIYRLNDEEYECFIFLLLREINNIFDMFYECISNNSFETFAKEYLGVRYAKKDRILDSLYMKNLNDSRRGCTDINRDILKIFDSENCNSVKSIVNILLGKPEKTELKTADYKHLKSEQEKVVKILKSASKKKQKGINILLYGCVGTGKTEFAKLVAQSAKMSLYAVTTEKECFKEATRDDRLIDFCSKQHILSRSNASCILFDEAEDVMNRGFSCFGTASKGYFNRLLENVSVPVIWTTNNISDVDPAFLRRMTYAVEFEKLSEEKRLDIWKKVVKKNNLKVKKSKLEKLNKSYDIPASLIANAVQTTKMIDGTEDDFEGFVQNVARVVNKKKDVKEKNTDTNLDNYNISLVNTDMDVDNLISKINAAGKLNFSLCLYGEAGTGKSLYARYLAKKLGLKVIFKRASDLKSKWVGETEQNIARAFYQAKEEGAVLIFDEADSFLQNRASADHSWEISEVNEMLTQMETHPYPFICTTNFMDSLDEASLRRFTFKIKFDFMTQSQVNCAIEHFFNIKNANVNIKGLTAGDFATVKKKADFLNIVDLSEIVKMLEDEVKIKKSSELKTAVGF